MIIVKVVVVTIVVIVIFTIFVIIVTVSSLLHFVVIVVAIVVIIVIVVVVVAVKAHVFSTADILVLLLWPLPVHLKADSLYEPASRGCASIVHFVAMETRYKNIS